MEEDKKEELFQELQDVCDQYGISMMVELLENSPDGDNFILIRDKHNNVKLLNNFVENFIRRNKRRIKKEIGALDV